MMNQVISVFGPKHNFVEYIRWLAAFLTLLLTPIMTYVCMSYAMYVIYAKYVIYHICRICHK